MSEIKEILQGECQCEWCGKKTKATFIHTTTGLTIEYDDPNFHAQIDWFVCGQCDEI